MTSSVINTNLGTPMEIPAYWVSVPHLGIAVFLSDLFSLEGVAQMAWAPQDTDGVKAVDWAEAEYLENYGWTLGEEAFFDAIEKHLRDMAGLILFRGAESPGVEAHDFGWADCDCSICAAQGPQAPDGPNMKAE